MTAGDVSEADVAVRIRGALIGDAIRIHVLLVGALTFVPALALGPIVEHFQLFAR